MAETRKVLFQSNPSAAALTDAYTVPALTQVIGSTINICNRSAAPTTFRLSIGVGGAADNDKQYLEYDAPILGNDAIPITIGYTLGAGDVIRVYATLATLSFSGFGVELT